MSTGLSIGEFSALTHLTIRTLRHYHRTGVLEPADVDPFTGYRYYTAEQIPSAQVIHRLRELDLPLPEVKALMATDDLVQRSEVISTHLARLQGELDRTRSAVVALQQLLRPDAQELNVGLRSLPTRTVAAITDVVQRSDIHHWYAAAMAELDAVVPASDRMGPPAGRYANALFTDGVGEMTVFYPVHDATASGRVQLVTLAPVDLAVTTHNGSHDAIAETYGRLGRWVVEHALAIDGPVHETYLVGPRETSADDQWRTEIGWPVFRITQSHTVGDRPQRHSGNRAGAGRRGL